MAEGLSARQGALALLRGVLGDRLMLSELGDRLEGLAPADRARAQRLALEVLRQVEAIDRLLQGFVQREPSLPVLNILRLAVAELSGGAAAHGVVNAAVEIARQDRRSAGAAGMVNAVLRKASGAKLVGSVQKMPRWLRQPLVHAWGRDAVAAIEAVQSKAPPLDLTVRGDEVPEGEVLPNGSLRLVSAGQVSGLKGYDAGGWWVQDAAAALAVPLLGDVAGKRVLDLCAAPGGKALQLAAAGAEVVALDISDARMKRLRENLARTGLAAEVVVADALRWQPDGAFDAIMLNAPCSATGTIRRHPDLIFVKDGTEIPELIDLQRRLLDRALGWLKPGGRLVYCTCSLLQEEGEQQLAEALLRHPGLRVVPPEVKGIDKAWVTPQGGLRLRPDYWAEKGGMDGFFMACVRQ